jgi:hypothetical protein
MFRNQAVSAQATLKVTSSKEHIISSVPEILPRQYKEEVFIV